MGNYPILILMFVTSRFKVSLTFIEQDKWWSKIIVLKWKKILFYFKEDTYFNYGADSTVYNI